MIFHHGGRSNFHTQVRFILLEPIYALLLKANVLLLVITKLNKKFQHWGIHILNYCLRLKKKWCREWGYVEVSLESQAKTQSWRCADDTGYNDKQSRDTSGKRLQYTTSLYLHWLQDGVVKLRLEHTSTWSKVMFYGIMLKIRKRVLDATRNHANRVIFHHDGMNMIFCKTRTIKKNYLTAEIIVWCCVVNSSKHEARLNYT